MQLPCLKQRSLSLLLLSCLLIVSIFESNTRVQSLVLPKNVKVPALLAFGDSIIDPGNNNNLRTLVKCNFSPYGRDYDGGKPTGRFSNGKIPTDLIAKVLGIKENVPAYLDPNLKTDDLLTGVSFASGGAGYDPLTSKLVGVIGLSGQLKLFKEYIETLKAYIGEDTANSIISDSLYIVIAGSDDIANTYYGTPVRKYKYDVHAYTDLMVQHACNFVQELYNLGARRIGVFGITPLGCVPSQRTFHGGILRECGEKVNKAAIMFNSKLSSTLDEFNNKLVGGKAVYVDAFNPFLDIITNYHSYGFEVATRGCCGTGTFEVSFLCNKLNPVTCEDASDYVFWDSYHPTQKAYEQLLYPVMEKLSQSLFCSSFPC
ncbi:hypothetical protein ACHQM5_029143 [Ranunculus cassubicifolius]